MGYDVSAMLDRLRPDGLADFPSLEVILIASEFLIYLCIFFLVVVVALKMHA